MMEVGVGEEQDNLAIWDSVAVTDPKFTKSFKRGGGFNGTATNATYLVRKATRAFGPVGIGWGWTIVDERVLDGHDITKVHRVHLRLWYKWKGDRGEVEHFGQTELVGKNKYGAFTDEEAPKKSLTDAITKCLSMLGFAADVHMGMYDDNRYVNDLKEVFKDDQDRQKTPSEKVDSKSDPKAAAGSVEASATKGHQKREYTSEEKADILIEKLRKDGKTPAAVAVFMTSAKVRAALDAIGPDLSKKVRDVGHELNAAHEAAAAAARAAANSDSRDGDEGAKAA